MALYIINIRSIHQHMDNTAMAPYVGMMLIMRQANLFSIFSHQLLYINGRHMIKRRMGGYKEPRISLSVFHPLPFAEPAFQNNRIFASYREVASDSALKALNEDLSRAAGTGKKVV